MPMKTRVCICGGGNLGHVVAGYLAAQDCCEVNMLTRHPERWQRQLAITTPEGEVLHGQLHGISAKPADVVKDMDIVLLCLPGFSIANVLRQIAPALSPQTLVGSIVSSTGFFEEALHILPEGTPLFGFQRVPFISRMEEYGHSAHLLGRRPLMRIGTEQVADKKQLKELLEVFFRIPVEVLGSYYEASLSNSNPILHPARLYTMWKDWQPGITYPRNNAFYGEWTEEASAIYIEMDKELHELLKVLPVSPDCLPTVLDYYESHDAASLTRKLRSIKAFQGIQSPMKETPEGFVPDLHSRYFTEDFPYGLNLIRQLAKEKNINTPTMDKVYQWGQQMIRYGDND
jgi:hypothetical protein